MCSRPKHLPGQIISTERRETATQTLLCSGRTSLHVEIALRNGHNCFEPYGFIKNL